MAVNPRSAGQQHVLHQLALHEPPTTHPRPGLPPGQILVVAGALPRRLAAAPPPFQPKNRRVQLPTDFAVPSPIQPASEARPDPQTNPEHQQFQQNHDSPAEEDPRDPRVGEEAASLEGDGKGQGGAQEGQRQEEGGPPVRSLAESVHVLPEFEGEAEGLGGHAERETGGGADPSL